VILAPSFADIFFNNCFKNGLLPIVLESKIIESLFAEVEAIPGFELSVDLEEQVIRMPDGGAINFEIEASRKHCLLNGLDDIGITLGDAELIRQFEDGWRATSPFYFTLK
jgi:3-isopropylmalate/(R)-2-methylmalate dehydratase small subunit